MDIVEAFEKSLEKDTGEETEEVLFAKKWVEAGLPTSACVMSVKDANEMLKKVSELKI